jgi:hypothetical protein
MQQKCAVEETWRAQESQLLLWMTPQAPRQPAHLAGQQVEGMQGVDAVVLAAEQPRNRLPVAAARRAPALPAAARPRVLPLQVHLHANGA